MRFTDSALETDLPKGVRDFLPLKAAKVEYLQQKLQQVYSAWGFRPVVTPQLEYFDVLERGLGEGLHERTFRFDDRQSGRMLAIPPDMTPQIARIVATRMSELPLPLRLCYSGRVLRHAEQQAGKDRDIFQSGVELIGVDNPVADAEMIAMAVAALQAVGAEEFTIDIGQVAFFRGVMEGLPLAPQLATQVADAILRKDSPELKLLLAGSELPDNTCEEILALPRLYGGREVLARAEKAVSNDRSKRALDSLDQVLNVLDVYGVLDHVTIDLGELRGLDYHTGITFQGFLAGFGHTVCNGGRYNNLTEQYGFSAPSTGFTFSLLPLLFALDKGLDERVPVHTDLLVFSKAEKISAGQKLACQLRSQGYSVALDSLGQSREEALEYAKQMNYLFMAVVAEEGQPVEIVSLASGEQTQVSWQQLHQDNYKLQ